MQPVTSDSDNLLRALFGTLTASGALIIIDMRNIVGNGNRSELACLYTYPAADTACLAGLSRNISLVL